MKVYIGGINGSGKTTIAKKLAELLGFKYISTSQLIMQKIGRPYDYEYLRSMPNEEQMEIREKIFDDLVSENRNIIVDSHYLKFKSYSWKNQYYYS